LIFLTGMLVRPRTPIFRMGPDSLVALCVAGVGLLLLARVQ
jgi:hypothetical protein